MPNPSTLAEASHEEYEGALRTAYDTRNTKATREAFLRRARELADELGLPQPGPINGLSTEQAMQSLGDLVDEDIDRAIKEGVHVSELKPQAHRSTATTFMPFGEKLFALTKGQRLILIDTLAYFAKSVPEQDAELAAERGELIRLLHEK